MREESRRFLVQLEKLIEEKGTAARVAKDCNISTAQISGWRQGALPGRASLTKIAERYNLTVGYLLGDEESPKYAGRRLTDDELAEQLGSYVLRETQSTVFCLETFKLETPEQAATCAELGRRLLAHCLTRMAIEQKALQEYLLTLAKVTLSFRELDAYAEENDSSKLRKILDNLGPQLTPILRQIAPMDRELLIDR